MKKFLIILIVFLAVLVLGLGIKMALLQNQVIIENNFNPGQNNKQNQAGFKKQVIKDNVQEYNLMFVGDIMLSRGVGNKMAREDDYNWPFVFIADYLNQADFLFGNLEGSISDKGADRGKKYSFRADPRAIDGLNLAGFDAVSVANNHAFDWGNEAFDDCIARLEKNNIKPVGYNKKPIVQIGDLKLGFLAYSPVNHDFKFSVMEQEIKQMVKQNLDLIIVSFHWGEEYKTHSNSSQQNLAKKAIDLGSDLIIGHHPHVVEEMDYYKGKPIFYSLGNFIFDQTWSKETMKGAIAKVVIKNKQIQTAELIHTQISPQLQIYLADNYKINSLINSASQKNNLTEKISYLAENFLNVSYKADTLIGGIYKQEELVIDLDNVDCFTLIDYLFALGLSQTSDEFVSNLKKVRYKNAQVGFTKRNHFFSQWIENNKDIVFNASRFIGTKKCQTKTLNQKQDGSVWVEGIDVFTQQICWAQDFDLSKLEPGDIIGFVTNKPGLDVTHLAVVVSLGNNPQIIHASSVEEKVIKQDLKDYLQDSSSVGLLIARPFDKLVDVQTIDSGIQLDLKYSTENNFLGEDVYGDLDKCLLQKEIALKLKQAQENLKKKYPDYNLLVFDCARPVSVQERMKQIVSDSDKNSYIADPGKSLHNFGAAVDLTIANSAGKQLDMGTEFDFLGKLSQPQLEHKFLDTGKLTWDQIANRELLRSVMTSAGFSGINKEWWHFNGVLLDQAQQNYNLVEFD